MKVDIGIFDFSQVHSYGSELGYLPEFYGKNMDLELTGYVIKIPAKVTDRMKQLRYQNSGFENWSDFFTAG